MPGSKETDAREEEGKTIIFSVVTCNSLNAAARHCQLLGCCCQRPLQSATATLTCHSSPYRIWQITGLVLHTYSEKSKSQKEVLQSDTHTLLQSCKLQGKTVVLGLSLWGAPAHLRATGWNFEDLCKMGFHRKKRINVTTYFLSYPPKQIL